MSAEYNREFKVPWAPHVVGKYVERDAENSEQRYEITCSVCKTKWGPTTCVSGRVRQHIANFALRHLHRDPLGPIRTT